MKRKNLSIQMILVALLIFGTAACGKQQAPYDEPKQEHEVEDVADCEDKIAEVDSYAEYDMFAWDVDADRCDFTDFPQRVLYDLPTRSLWQYYPADRGGLCEWSVYGDHPQTNIYALPDDSGRFVRVVMGLEDYIIKREEVNDYLIKYKDWYYADGFLYFTVEYNDFDEEASIGWRDGYRRLQSDVYRLKVGEHAAGLLYSY